MCRNLLGYSPLIATSGGHGSGCCLLLQLQNAQLEDSDAAMTTMMTVTCQMTLMKLRISLDAGV